MATEIDDFTSPNAFRALLRQGRCKGKPTAFVSKGYKQANLAIMPKEYAEDFFNFAKGNAGAVPVLYKSEPGEFKAPPLCADSDVRVEVPLYAKIVDGEVVGKVEDLLEYDMSNYVSFYIGCSFSFNDILLSNQILAEKDAQSNVSMFVSGIDCYRSGKFACKMVVSMRAINKSKLSLTATLCESLYDVHGPPIHYGNPKAIGIDDSENPHFGDKTHFEPDETPVFWCCGVTGLQALKSAKIALSFSHSPGCMFVTDVIQEKVSVDPSNITCKVVSYNEKSNLFSSLSQSCLNKLHKLNDILLQDVQNRKVAHSSVQEDFVKAALALSHASSVAIITGLPTDLDPDSSNEIAALPGVIGLATVLHSLGKKVVLHVDELALAMNVELMERLAEKRLLKEPIKVAPYVAKKLILEDKDNVPFYDVMLTSGDDISLEAVHCDDVTTITIGNENGHCYGLTFALYALRSCSVHDRYYRRAVGFPTDASEIMKDCLPSNERERRILEVAQDLGKTNERKHNGEIPANGKVCGEKDHAGVLEAMLKLLWLNNN